MARQIIDVALLEIDYSGGSKQLRTVRSISFGGDNPSTPVKTMTPENRAIGFTNGVPDYPVELEVAELKGTPEVDWDQLLADKEIFTITAEEGRGGRRRSLIDMIVNTISKPFDADGEHRRTISAMCLDEKPES